MIHQQLYRKRLLSWITVVGILIISWIIYYRMFIWFSPYSLVKHMSLLGADSWEPLKAMQKSVLTFNMNEMKHPLFFVVTKVLSQGLASLIKLSVESSAMIVLSFYSALNIALFWILISCVTLRSVNRIFLTLLFAFSFVSLVLFSIPETYSFTTLSILLFLLTVVNQTTLSKARIILSSTFAGTAALSNPPMLALILITVFLIWQKDQLKRNLVKSAFALSWSLLVFSLPNALIIYIGRDLVGLTTKYLNHYASFHNFLKPGNYLQILINLIFYMFISPMQIIRYDYSLNHFQYFAHPLQVITFLLHIAFIFIALKNVRDLINKNSLSLLTFLVVISAFFIYFNPGEILLYSIQILIPVLVLFAQSLKLDHIKTKIFALTYVTLVGATNIWVISESIRLFPGVQ